jgi:hypothetical protein
MISSLSLDRYWEITEQLWKKFHIVLMATRTLWKFTAREVAVFGSVSRSHFSFGRLCLSCFFNEDQSHAWTTLPFSC